MAMQEMSSGTSGGDGEELLFRRAAVQSLTYRDNGRVVSYFIPAWWHLGVFLLCVVVLLAILVVFAPYARKESVYGVLHNSAGEVRVLAFRPGTVERLFVAEGDMVVEGQALAHISNVIRLPGGQPYQEKRHLALMEELGTVNELLAGLEGFYAKRTAELRVRMEGLTRQMDALGAHRTEEDGILHVLEQVDAADVRRVEASTGDRMPADRQAMPVRRQKSAISSLNVQMASLQSEYDVLQTRIDLLVAERHREQSNLRGQKSRIEQNLADVQSQTHYTLTAAIDGMVTAQQLSTGDFVTPESPLMTIVADDSTLYANIYINTRAIGFVEPGQRVVMMYDSFPHERFGVGFGSIESISDSVLSPEEIKGVFTTEEPVYKARVALEKPYIEAFGKRYKLRSGIGMRAEIILEQRTFLQWLTDPVRARMAKRKSPAAQRMQNSSDPQ